MNFSDNRRRFLKAAGVAIALPVMKSYSFGEDKKATPKRVKRFLCVSNNYGIYAKGFFPKQGGKNYELSPILKPMERHRNDFTVFSNLDHGLSGGHVCVPSLLNGMKPNMAHNFPEGNISLDQKFAEFVGPQTRFSSMTLHIKEKNNTSYTRTGVQVPGIDLVKMYRNMFLEDSAQAKKEELLRLERNRSILDTVLAKAKKVDRQLDKQDKEKFAEYLHSVRSLEKKILQQKPWLDIPKPKTSYKQPRMMNTITGDMKTMMDLIGLAIETDSCRSFSLACGVANGDFGLQGGYHPCSHHNEQPDKVALLKKIDGHRFEMIAYLIDFLKSKKDPLNLDGTLFDHTMILHGCGMAEGTHGTKNLPLALAGGGFKLGEHMVLPDGKGKRVLASNLLLSIAQNFGLEVDRFGNSTGTLPGLEWKS